MNLMLLLSKKSWGPPVSRQAPCPLIEGRAALTLFVHPGVDFVLPPDCSARSVATQPHRFRKFARLHAPRNFSVRQLHLIPDFGLERKRFVIAIAPCGAIATAPGLDARRCRELSVSGHSEQGRVLLLVKLQCGFHLRKVFPTIINRADA